MTKHSSIYAKTFSLIILIFGTLLPSMVIAAEMQVMVGIPGVEVGKLSMENYLEAIYWLAITIAAVLAILKIVLAGISYVMSDVVTSKETAKKSIWGSLFGLLIVLAAVIILNTINTDLTNFSIFGTIAEQAVEVETELTESETVEEDLIECADGNPRTDEAGNTTCVPLDRENRDPNVIGIDAREAELVRIQQQIIRWCADEGERRETSIVTLCGRDTAQREILAQAGRDGAAPEEGAEDGEGAEPATSEPTVSRYCSEEAIAESAATPEEYCEQLSEGALW